MAMSANWFTCRPTCVLAASFCAIIWSIANAATCFWPWAATTDHAARLPIRTPCWAPRNSGNSSPGCCSGSTQRLLQLATFIHLHHDVGAADELAFDIELRNGRPVAVFLDAVANGFVFQYVDSLDGLGIDAAGLQNLHRTAGEATLWESGVTLHE